MTLSTVRGVEPLDFSNREHRALIFDVALSNKQHLLNDYDNDIVLIIQYYETQAGAGNVYPFVAFVDGQPAGCFWLETDQYEIGRVRGALLPEYRTGWNGLFFLRWLTEYAFDVLGLRKLDAELFQRRRGNDPISNSAEKLLKRIGFRYICTLRESLMVNGQPRNTVLLDYLKREYDVKKEK